MTKADARAFSRRALGDLGLTAVRVAPQVDPCSVAGARGWRVVSVTSAGPVTLCVSRSGHRALAVRTQAADSLTSTQYDRLERFRSDPASERVLPLAALAAALLLVGAASSLGLALTANRKDRP
jgi:hypothetical protein